MLAARLLFLLHVKFLCKAARGVLIFLFSAVIFHQNPAHARVFSIRQCNQLLKESGLEGQTKVRDLFTQMPAICAKSKSGAIAMKFTLRINKRDGTPTQMHARHMVASMVENLPKVICNQPDMQEMVKNVNVIYEFVNEDGVESLGFFELTEASCKIVTAQPVNIGGETDLKTCEIIANTNRKSLPKKLNDRTTRVDVVCRPGMTKPSYLAFIDEVEFDEPAERIQQALSSKDFHDEIKKSYCSNNVTRGLLASMDLGNIYRSKGAVLSEVKISQIDCR